jgi:hypothetical protein
MAVCNYAYVRLDPLMTFVGKKRQPVVVWDLMWTPVDVRFKEVLQALRRHQQLVKDELSILQAKAANDAEVAAQQERYLAARERRMAETERQKITEILQQTEDIKLLIIEDRKGGLTLVICSDNHG